MEVWTRASGSGVLAVVVARSIDRLVRVENRILGEWMCVGGEGEEEAGDFIEGSVREKQKARTWMAIYPGTDSPVGSRRSLLYRGMLWFTQRGILSKLSAELRLTSAIRTKWTSSMQETLRFFISFLELNITNTRCHVAANRSWGFLMLRDEW